MIDDFVELFLPDFKRWEFCVLIDDFVDLFLPDFKRWEFCELIDDFVENIIHAIYAMK